MENKTTFKEQVKIFLSQFDKDGDGRLDFAQLGKAWHKLFSFIRVVLETVSGFAKNRQGFQAVALSYFGLLAFVPMLAFIFAVTGGLGFADEGLWHMLLGRLNILADKPDMVDWIINFATTIVEQAQSGVVGLVSALLFLWTIIWLFFQVERVFNFVWKATNKRDRNILVRFGWFILMLLLTPFILIIFGGSLLLYSNAFKFMDFDLGAFNKLPEWLLIGGIAAVIFSLMFKYIPEVRIKYKYAFVAALVTAVVFMFFQFFYLKTQMFVTRLNGVYGVMAAVPLFLIWMNFSWQIILYGANLCRALQINTLGEEFAFTETPKQRRRRLTREWKARNKRIAKNNKK